MVTIMRLIPRLRKLFISYSVLIRGIVEIILIDALAALINEGIHEPCLCSQPHRFPTTLYIFVPTIGFFFVMRCSLALSSFIHISVIRILLGVLCLEHEIAAMSRETTKPRTPTPPDAHR